MELTKKDKEDIIKLSKDKKLFEKLSESFAPEIYGYDKVKLAILIQMVGGVKKKSVSGVYTRGNIHILIIGDPSSGKTKLLKIASEMIPDATYISGRHTNAGGLTGTLRKTDKGYDTIPGALTNYKFCALDQLDTITAEDRSSMYEALKNQEITICQYDTFKTLKADTSLLAAAAPKYGRFDPYDSLARQINLPPGLISRFDLIFAMKDVPDKEIDSNIIDNIMSFGEPIKAPISIELLKKYIAHAKDINPTWTKEAKEIIKNFYIEVRSGCINDSGIVVVPISVSQLEGLIRLSEGLSKLRLSSKVEIEDSKNAINLLRYCYELFGSEGNVNSIDLYELNSILSAEDRKNIKNIKEIIIECEAVLGKCVPIHEIVNKAFKVFSLDETEVEEVIDRLKRQGDIFEPRRGLIQRI